MILNYIKATHTGKTPNSFKRNKRKFHPLQFNANQNLYNEDKSKESQ